MNEIFPGINGTGPINIDDVELVNCEIVNGNLISATIKKGKIEHQNTVYAVGSKWHQNTWTNN